MTEPIQELTLFKGSSSPIINLGTFVACGLVLVASLIFAFLVQAPFVRFVLAALALVALGYIGVQWLLIKVRLYEVTTERIRITNGVFTRRTEELELYRVKDTTLIEPLFLRLFSVGNIEVTTHDVSTPVVVLQAINGARALREELRKSIEDCRDKKRVRLAELE